VDSAFQQSHYDNRHIERESWISPRCPGTGYTTLELKVNFVRGVPLDAGKLVCEGTTIHVGRRTATAEGRVLDASGRLAAHGTTTCMIFQPEK
jgi:uncharacterized protein (TIGR00369 family)